MNSVIQYVLQKASKVTNADALCCNCWKFVTQQKRRSEHAGNKFFKIFTEKIKIDHKTITKCDYAANLKSDKIAHDDEAKKFEVTKEKIIKLAKEYHHVDREGKVKKIPIEKTSSNSDSQDNISNYLTRQAERSVSTVPKKVVQKPKIIQGKLF